MSKLERIRIDGSWSELDVPIEYEVYESRTRATEPRFMTAGEPLDGDPVTEGKAFAAVTAPLRDGERLSGAGNTPDEATADLERVIIERLRHDRTLAAATRK
jgi:hypothetical protein